MAYALVRSFLQVSDLSFIERSRLEKLFGMGGGYVLRACSEPYLFKSSLLTVPERRNIYCGKLANIERLQSKSLAQILGDRA